MDFHHQLHMHGTMDFNCGNCVHWYCYVLFIQIDIQVTVHRNDLYTVNLDFVMTNSKGYDRLIIINVLHQSKDIFVLSLNCLHREYNI